MKVTIYGKRKSVNGEPTIDFNKKIYKAAIAHIPEGDSVQIVISNEKTNDQLAKIHVLIKEFAEYTGYTFDEAKKEVKRMTGFYEYVEENGEKIKYILSFADASKDDLSKVISQLESWMIEQGIVSPNLNY